MQLTSPMQSHEDGLASESIRIVAIASLHVVATASTVSIYACSYESHMDEANDEG